MFWPDQVGPLRSHGFDSPRITRPGIASVPGCDGRRCPVRRSCEEEVLLTDLQGPDQLAARLPPGPLALLQVGDGHLGHAVLLGEDFLGSVPSQARPPESRQRERIRHHVLPVSPAPPAEKLNVLRQPPGWPVEACPGRREVVALVGGPHPLQLIDPLRFQTEDPCRPAGPEEFDLLGPPDDAFLGELPLLALIEFFLQQDLALADLG